MRWHLDSGSCLFERLLLPVVASGARGERAAYPIVAMVSDSQLGVRTDADEAECLGIGLLVD